MNSGVLTPESDNIWVVLFISMKRWIFILLLLTVVVTLPPVYLRWAESQRLKQIREVKKQARPASGERLETVLLELRNGERPSVVMSYCPFGVQAEKNIIPIVKKFGDQIDFKLQFIAEEKPVLSPQDITPFRSLHGYPEVVENIMSMHS